MGNVLSFERKAGENQKGNRVIQNPRLAEILEEEIAFGMEYDDVLDLDDEEINEFLDDTYKLISEIDEFVLKTIEETDIRDAEFMIDDNSIVRIINGIENEYCIEYRGRGTATENKADYHIFLASYDDEDEPGFTALFLKFTDTSALRYHHDTKTWEEDKCLRTLYDAINNGEGVAKFAQAFTEKTGYDILTGDSESMVGLIMQVQPLCKLYELLSDVADFQITYSLDSQPDDEDGAQSFCVSVMLLPDDYLREGCMVAYYQGKFRVLRCFDPYMLSEMYEDWNGDPDMMDEPYRVEAFSEASIRKTAQTLREMWDHYSKDTVFCFPLSNSAYTEYRTYSGKLVTVTRNGTRKLTSDESAALCEVKDILQLT